MSGIERRVIKDSGVLEFLESIIWQTDTDISSASSSPDDESNKNLKYISLLERILDLFTRKEYKWQIEKTDNISYSESEKRICLSLIIFSIIFLSICSFLSILLSSAFHEKTENASSNNYYIHEIGKSLLCISKL